MSRAWIENPAVGNACVLSLAVVKDQEVLVVGVHHAALAKGKGKVGVVLGTAQSHLRRGRYVDAAAAMAFAACLSR